MGFNETIDSITKFLIVIFNAGIVARIIKILINGQSDEEQQTRKLVKNHIKAALIVNLISSLVLLFVSYYL